MIMLSRSYGCSLEADAMEQLSGLETEAEMFVGFNSAEYFKTGKLANNTLRAKLDLVKSLLSPGLFDNAVI